MSAESLKISRSWFSVRFSTKSAFVFTILVSLFYLLYLYYFVNTSSEYDSFTDLNREIHHFQSVSFGFAIFLIISFTSSTYYSSQLGKILDDLKLVFYSEEERYFETEELSGLWLGWYNNFRSDLTRRNWILYYAILGIFIGSPVYYYFWGYRIHESFGLVTFIVNYLLVYLPITFVIFWVLWLMIAQYVHFYSIEFDKKNMDKMYLGLNTQGNILYKIGRMMLPINIQRQRIKPRLFDVDNTGGLSAISRLSSNGVFLLALTFSIATPILLLTDVMIALVILPVFFFIILGSYVVGIAQVKSAIKNEKRSQLKIVNDRISELSHKILEVKGIDPNEEELLLSKINNYIELRKLILFVKEGPNLRKILISPPLPIISYFLVQLLNYLAT